MRLNGIVIKNNLNTLDLEGRFTLSAAAAVVAVQGDDFSVTKTGVGTYRVRFGATAIAGYKVVNIIQDDAKFGTGGVPTTAVNVRVSGVATDTTPGATLGDCIIDITTANATWVPTDCTAACSVCFRVVIQHKPKV